MNFPLILKHNGLRKTVKKCKHLTTKTRKKCKPKIDHPKQTIIQHSTSSTEFVTSVADELYHKHLKPYLEQLQKPTQKPCFHSRAETAKILGIALSNLAEKTKDGTITASRLGGRVLYSDTDIANALTKIRTV
jgi:hypothetical protein